MFGGIGDDWLFGESGSDQYFGGPGEDVLDSVDGSDDKLNGGPGGGILKGQFLCVGDDPATCERFLDFAEHDLPVDWEFVRD